MSQKTKTIIKGTEEVSERDNQPVLAYRVGQLELAMKDATLAQREGTEKLATKIDGYAHNFASKSELADVETVLDKRLTKLENWLTWIGRTVIGAVVAAVLGLVLWTTGGI